MKKRFFSALLAAVLSLSILVSCSSPSSDSPASTGDQPLAVESGSPEQPTGSIEMWSMLTQQSRADELQKLADSYVLEHQDTEVNITVMPWSGAMHKIVASIMAGNAPDVMVTGTGYPQSLAATGGLLEISDLVEEVGGTSAFLSTSLSV
ncbi:MAG: extracellular solute-binding protein, partial [Acetanaerobacterium sp.]